MALGWKGLQRWFSFNLPIVVRVTTTRPACPESHAAWPWMPPRMGQPQPLLATLSSVSPPSYSTREKFKTMVGFHDEEMCMDRGRATTALSHTAFFWVQEKVFFCPCWEQCHLQEDLGSSQCNMHRVQKYYQSLQILLCFTGKVLIHPHVWMSFLNSK